MDTSKISSHIIQSIEMPLRKIINSTIKCKINEELKEDIVSGKVLKDVKGQLETLQRKIDDLNGDHRNRFTELKQDIVILREDIGGTLTREILEQSKNLTNLVDT